MAFLQNLKVSKVSFVNRAANKRKFLLLKSVDGKEREIEQPTDKNQESNPMLKDDVQKSVRLLLKANMTDEKIVETIKSEFKISDSETAELKAALAISRSMAESLVPTAPKDPKDPKITKEVDPEDEDDSDPAIRKELADMRKENSEMRETIKKDAEDRKKGEIRIWLSENCTHLTADANQMVDDIFKMQAANPEGSERLKASLKASSDAIKNSSFLVEKGSSFDTAPVPTGDVIMKKVRTTLDEIQKSGTSVVKGSDVIINAVKSLGANAYKQYRSEHNYRAKHSG
jgi:hypothetical protein